MQAAASPLPWDWYPLWVVGKGWAHLMRPLAPPEGRRLPLPEDPAGNTEGAGRVERIWNQKADRPKLRHGWIQTHN